MSDSPMKKQALLIGINQYEILPELKYARQDAEAVEQALKQNYSFTDDEVILLTDAKPGLFKPINRRVIEKHLEKLANQDLDLFIFGFWGHGLFRNGQRYFCPLDAISEDIESLGLPFETVQQLLSNIKAKNTCLILDCCQKVHDRGEEETLTAADQFVMENAARDIVLKRQETEPEFVSNVAILNSCKEGQAAYEWDNRQHGIFTAHLLDAMNRRLDSVAQIVGYTSRNVEKTAMELGKTQTPFFKLEGDILLPVETKTAPLATGDVFISYRHCNAELVAPVEEELKRRGISYFIDRVGVNYGMDYSEALTRAIASSKLLVLFWTPEVKGSEDIVNEVVLALRLKKIVIPYKIGNFNEIDHSKLCYHIARLSHYEVLQQTPETIVNLVNRVEQALTGKEFPAPVPSQPTPTLTVQNSPRPQTRVNAPVPNQPTPRPTVQNRPRPQTRVNAPVPNQPTPRPTVQNRPRPQTRVNAPVQRKTTKRSASKSNDVKWYIFLFLLIVSFGLATLYSLTVSRHKSKRAYPSSYETYESEYYNRSRARDEAAPQDPNKLPASGSKAGERAVIIVDNIEYAFRWCPAGTFTMGAPKAEEKEWQIEVNIQMAEDEEGVQMAENTRFETQHEVTLSKGFWMMETEVTVGMYKAFVRETKYESSDLPWVRTESGVQQNPSITWRNPGFSQDDNHPVTNLNWKDAVEFCKWLSKKTEQKIQLPTEAQWEYACRAGTRSPFAGNLDDMAWYAENSGNTTHPVGTKKPNSWGLYDMHGNEWEWCQDWLGPYPNGRVTDPTGYSQTDALRHIQRGGNKYSQIMCCRSACRFDPDPVEISCGFRCVKVE